MKNTWLRTAGGLLIATSMVAALTIHSQTSEAKSKGKTIVSVAAPAFTDDLGSEGCRVAKGHFAFYRPDAEGLGEDCDLVAGIQLPHDSELSSINCTVYDDYAANAIEMYLVRVDLETGDPEVVFQTSGTIDSGLVQHLDDADGAEAGTELVDNWRYAYYVTAAFPYTDFTTVGTGLRVYGCSVEVF